MHLDTNGNFWIRQVVPGKGFVLDLEHFRLQEFSFSNEDRKSPKISNRNAPYKIVVQSYSDGRPQRELILDPAKIAANPKALSESALLEYNVERIQALRRCKKCLLPETFPFIEYDGRGICNYCNNYIIKNHRK